MNKLYIIQSIIWSVTPGVTILDGVSRGFDSLRVGLVFTDMACIFYSLILTFIHEKEEER